MSDAHNLTLNAKEKRKKPSVKAKGGNNAGTNYRRNSPRVNLMQADGNNNHDLKSIRTAGIGSGDATPAAGNLAGQQ